MNVEVFKEAYQMRLEIKTNINLLTTASKYAREGKVFMRIDEGEIKYLPDEELANKLNQVVKEHCHKKILELEEKFKNL